MSEPGEFWVLQEFGSNRALLRSHGEKWPNDVNGEPGPVWVRVVHGSAFDALKIQLAQAERERDALGAMVKLQSSQLTVLTALDDTTKQLAAWRAEASRLAGVLSTVSSGEECSACSCSCHSHARQAVAEHEALKKRMGQE